MRDLEDQVKASEEHTRTLKEKARELYPDVNKLTLATSDAILITHYAKEEYFNGKM